MERRHDNGYYKFLAAILSEDSLDAAVSLNSSWHWEDFIRIASDETILPPLSGRLGQLGLLDRLPVQVVDFLQAFTALNATRNEQILSEIAAISALLNREGIEPVILKGPAYLLAGAYHNPADRFILDIDLLVPKEQIDLAFSVLRGAAYSVETPDPVAFAAHHLPALTQPDKIRVEVHHSLGSSRCDSLLPPDEIYRRSSRVQLQNTNVRLPHPEDLIAHLIVHSQIHHGSEQRVWPPLRAQYDLFLLTRRFAHEVDWLLIRERFQLHRYLGVLELHLLQVSTVLRQPPPIPLSLGLFTRLQWLHRRMLWRAPWLRFVDPIFFVSSAANIRPSLSRLIELQGGAHYLLTPHFLGRAVRKLINSFRR